MLQMLMAGASLVLLILVTIILARQYQQCWQMHQQALLALVHMSERMATIERKLDAVTKRVMQIAAMPPAECDTDRGSRVRREQSGLLEGAAGSQDAVTRRSSSQADRVHSVTDTISRMPSASHSRQRRAPSGPTSSELSAAMQSDADGGKVTFKRVMSDTLMRVPSTSSLHSPADLGGVLPDERMMMSEGRTCVQQDSRKKEPASPSAGMISPDDALRCIQHACVHTYTEYVYVCYRYTRIH